MRDQGKCVVEVVVEALMWVEVLLLADHGLSMARYSCVDWQQPDLTFSVLAAAAAVGIVNAMGYRISELVVEVNDVSLVCERRC